MPPGDGGIELVAVDDPAQPFANAVVQFLENRREGMYALVLQTNDISVDQEMFVERGLRVSISVDSQDVLEVDHKPRLVL